MKNRWILGPFIGVTITPFNLPETNSEFAPEKKGWDWKIIIHSFWGPLGRIFRGELLLLVCREGNNPSP